MVNEKMKKSLIKWAAAALSFAMLTGCARQTPKETSYPDITPSLIVDFGDHIADMKPVNGINNGPVSQSTIDGGEISWGLDMSSEYSKLNIPFVRTHDTEYPNGKDTFIDVHCIFPDFDRDPDDEDAYHFSGTDEYIEKIQATGAEVFYRLGESIAPSVSEAVYQRPPKDFEKWARVCEHIVAHYNYGWKDGFNYDIHFWEIWNEPDQQRQWVGTIEAYYELYRITARHLKGVYPGIMVGGGVLASAEEENIQAFLDGINSDGMKTPVDFFSWHIYTNHPDGIVHRANLARKLLDENGYPDALTFLDEWNYVDDWNDISTTWQAIRSPSICAFYTACLIMMQDSAVDGAMYYDGSLTGDIAQWCGLYDSDGNLLPGYYSFQSFQRLIRLRRQSKIYFDRDPHEQGVYACAASGKEEDAVLVANISDNVVRFPLLTNSKYQKAELTRINEKNPDSITTEMESFSDEEIIEMQAGETLLIILSE